MANLTQRRWPELIAHEPKKDDGLDAYAPPSLSGDRTGRGVACSTTPTISKVSEDAKKAKEKFPGLKTLIFVTSGKVSRITATKWAKQILKDYELELQVVSREDIITTLMLPENASICATFLNIDLRPQPTLAEHASSVCGFSWSSSRRRSSPRSFRPTWAPMTIANCNFTLRAIHRPATSSPGPVGSGSSDGKGNGAASGGLRVIYYHLPSDTQVWLITVYDKHEAADLSPAERLWLVRKYPDTLERLESLGVPA